MLRPTLFWPVLLAAVKLRGKPVLGASKSPFRRDVHCRPMDKTRALQSKRIFLKVKCDVIALGCCSAIWHTAALSCRVEGLGRGMEGSCRSVDLKLGAVLSFTARPWSFPL